MRWVFVDVLHIFILERGIPRSNHLSLQFSKEEFLKLWFLKQFPGNRRIRTINASILRCYTSESYNKDKINHLHSLESP